MGKHTSEKEALQMLAKLFSSFLETFFIMIIMFEC